MQLRHSAARVQRTRRSAFTLLEILVVVAIIVMIAGSGAYYVFQRYASAQEDKARIDCVKLANMVEQFNLKNNPEIVLNSLSDLTGGDAPFAQPQELVDPWGKQYQYAPAEGMGKPTVFTTSPKGKVINNQTMK